MKVISIDIETTGLDPEYCQVIEFAAICDDFSCFSTPIEKLPTFHRYVWHERYQGEPYAINMHAGYFEKRARFGKEEGNPDVWSDSSTLMLEFHGWLEEIKYGPKIIVAGKNFQGFDQKFLEKLRGYEWPDPLSTSTPHKWHHRSVDPTMLYTNLIRDTEPPSLDVCLERFTGDKLSKAKHTALEDAQDVLRLLRAWIEATGD
jgi:DNA polymerase III epsilon subunit-like protein